MYLNPCPSSLEIASVNQLSVFNEALETLGTYHFVFCSSPSQLHFLSFFFFFPHPNFSGMPAPSREFPIEFCVRLCFLGISKTVFIPKGQGMENDHSSCKLQKLSLQREVSSNNRR